MKRGWVMATVLAFMAASIPAGAAEAASMSRPGCLATSDAAHAATRLLDPAATVVSLDDAGRSALVSVPLVVTGARHRLLRTSDGWWCDALAGYNAMAA